MRKLSASNAFFAASCAEPASRKEFSLALDGRQAVIGYSAVPLLAKDGKCLGSAVLFQNITPFLKKDR